MESQSLHFGSLAPPSSLKPDPVTGGALCATWLRIVYCTPTVSFVLCTGYYVGPRELQSLLSTIPVLGSSVLPTQQQQQQQEQVEDARGVELR